MVQQTHTPMVRQVKYYTLWIIIWSLVLAFFYIVGKPVYEGQVYYWSTNFDDIKTQELRDYYYLNTISFALLCSISLLTIVFSFIVFGNKIQQYYINHIQLK